MTTLSDILVRFPFVEVLARQIYWRIPALRRAVGKRQAVTVMPYPGTGDLLAELTQAAQDLGIMPGDVVIVHAATSRLARSGLDPAKLLAGLRDLVGGAGTIVMPAIPILKGEPAPGQRFNDRLHEDELVYRPRRERIWTGILPLLLTKTREAKLSAIPLNTLLAIGEKADEIIDNSSIGDGLAPCGKGSPWEKCLEYNAKILMIDVGIAKSITMIHTVEDLFEEEWPIRNWYRERKYLIKIGTTERRLTVRERHPKWSLFFAEKRLDRDLAEAVFRHADTPSGISIDVAASQELVDFLRSKRPSTYPYWIPSYIGTRRK